MKHTYDCIVIGGGIVGLSTAWQLLRADARRRVLVVEKQAALARHQTGRTSGVIHAGVYYPPDSLKARFCKEGNAATKALCQRHGIAFETCGKVLVATDDTELARMDALWQRIGSNGLERRWLDADALREYEPNVRGVAGVFAPSSGIVDYREVAAAMAREFKSLGGEIRLDCELNGLKETAGEVVAETTRGAFHGRYLVACAGLMADRLVQMLGIDPDFRICPFRGEYYRLAARHNDIVRHLIYPIPDPAMPFLGVHLTRMIDGSVTVGPNAVLAFKREGYGKAAISLADTARMLAFPGIRTMLKRHLRPGLTEMKHSLSKRSYLGEVRKYCPSLTLDDLEPHPAGVRAQAVTRDGTLVGDFLFTDTARTLHVCNAPSPAATSALPIGAHIVARLESRLTA